MKGYEITKHLKERRKADQQFIKWWRRENDFLDYDLIDRYLANFDDSEEIENFDLLDSEEMWRELKRICGNRLNRSVRNGSEYLSWRPASGKGASQWQECSFSPESLISIFDVETKDNPVDS